MTGCLGTQESSWMLVLPRSPASVFCDKAKAEAGLGQCSQQFLDLESQCFSMWSQSATSVIITTWELVKISNPQLPCTPTY